MKFTKTVLLLTDYVHKTMLILLLAAAVLGQHSCDFASLIDTKETYVIPNDSGPSRICLKCPPGSYRIPGEHCVSPNSIDHCGCCPPNTFQPDYVDTVTSCTDCQPCRNNEQIIQKCNRTHATKCSCKKGHFYIKRDDACIEHKACETGFGVRMSGNQLVDTVCEFCLDGETFSNVSSKIEQCHKCTVCTEGYETTQLCTPESDTVCEKKKDYRWVPGLAVAVVLVLVVSVVACVMHWRPNYLTRFLPCFCTKQPDEEQPDGIYDHLCKKSPGPEETFREVFRVISEQVIQDWQHFIRDLDWKEIAEVENIINRAIADKKTVREQIMDCLNKYREFFPKTTPGEFVEHIRDDKKQLKETLRETIASLSPQSPNEVTNESEL